MKKRNMKVLALLMTVTMAGTMLAGCGDSGSTSTRSEERRVGKECRSRWSPYH